MDPIDISIQSRVVIGISAMVVLFASFLIVFISNQRKKLQYHKNLQAMHEEQQNLLKEQNLLLEQRVKERTAELSEQKDALQKQNNQTAQAAQADVKDVNKKEDGIFDKAQNLLMLLSVGFLGYKLLNKAN